MYRIHRKTEKTLEGGVERGRNGRNDSGRGPDVLGDFGHYGVGGPSRTLIVLTRRGEWATAKK